MKTIEEREQSRGEEIANAITHGLGATFVVAASPFLLRASLERGGSMAVVGTSIFACSAALLYVASTLYHAAQSSEIKQTLEVVDRIAIYLLIAGTYTPFMLGTLRGPWGWSLLGIVWGFALLGILQELVTSRRRVSSLVLYLGMGWLAIVAIVPLVTRVQFCGVVLIFAGGFAYTLGIVFYAMQRFPYFHTVWHLFVLAGTSFHCLAVMHYAV